MSVKFHYGMRAQIPDEGPWALFDQIRTEMADVANTILRKHIAQGFDKIRELEPERRIAAIAVTLTTVMSEAFQPDPTTVVFPHPTETDQVLLVPYGWCQHDLFDRFLTLDGFHEYSYWDNTDRPQRFSVADWNERYTMWRLACNDWVGTVAGAGISITADVNVVQLVTQKARELGV